MVAAMPKANTAWKVLAHGPIEKLADNLWWVQGALPGMSLKRVMTVVRLGDGRLVIHNGIALEPAAMKELEAWGTPAFLIVPNGAHRLDAPAYKQRYPQLKVLAPKGARAKVEEVVAVDGGYEDFPADENVRFELLHGVKDREGAMLVRSNDGLTVVLNDAVFNMDKKQDLLGWFFTTVLGSAPGPRISRLAKLAFIADKQALRADLERFAALPELTRLIVAHEKVASGPDARSALQRAATYL
jgi:hypothetical protein